MSEETETQDFYLEPERKLPRARWLVAGLLILLILGAGGLVLAVASGILPNPIAVAPRPTSIATATPLPLPTDTPAPPVVTFAANPWTDGNGPVDLVELTLSVPAQAHVRFTAPSGFRYWRGDLLPTRDGLAWSGSEPAQVHWFLLRKPGTTLPATVEVIVNEQTLALSLQPGTPATTSALLE